MIADVLDPLAADRYRTGRPFPHIVIDKSFDPHVLEEVAREASATNGEDDPAFYGQRGKRTLTSRHCFGPKTSSLIEYLNGPEFVCWLQELTGIENLFPDPALVGGGVHRSGRGAFLKIHTDFNWHRGLRLHRRVNLLLYLNEDWQEAWGGQLELWPADMSACAVRIAPLFNRVVIFSTTDESYHGHPEPLDCPEGVTRNSIALYYYSSEPAPNRRFDRSELTNYRTRPGERRSIKQALHHALLSAPRLRSALYRFR